MLLTKITPYDFWLPKLKFLKELNSKAFDNKFDSNHVDFSFLGEAMKEKDIEIITIGMHVYNGTTHSAGQIE